MRRAFHYVATIKGPKPTRFYVTNGTISAAAAHAFANWARASDMTLWPTDTKGVYRAAWFDTYADAFRETTLTVLEEQAC